MAIIPSEAATTTGELLEPDFSRAPFDFEPDRGPIPPPIQSPETSPVEASRFPGVPGGTPISFAPDGTPQSADPIADSDLIRIANADRDTPLTPEETEKKYPGLSEWMKQAQAGVPTFPPWEKRAVPAKDINEVVPKIAESKRQDASDALYQAHPPSPVPPIRETPQTPESTIRHMFNTFTNPLMLLAAVGGASTKLGARGALAAMTGVMEGMNQRDWEKAYLQQNKFRSSVKETALGQELEIADVSGVLNSAKPDAEKLGDIAAIAEMHQDPWLAKLGKGTNLGPIYEWRDSHQKVTDNLHKSMREYNRGRERLSEQEGEFSKPDPIFEIEAQREAAGLPIGGRPSAKDQRRISGRANYIRTHPDQAIELPEKPGAVSKREAEERKVLEKIPPALRNQIQDHYPDLDVREELGGIGPKQGQQLEAAINTTTNLEDVAEFTVNNPGALGYLADLSKRLNADAAIDTFRGRSPSDPTTKQIADQITDRHINDSAGGKNLPDAAAAKVLAKMLTTQAFNDAAAAGARGATVYLDKAFREIYQQASSPEAFFHILHTRYQSADNEMSGYHMGIDKRNDLRPNPEASDRSTRRGHPFWDRGPDAYVRDFRQKRDQQKVRRPGQSGPQEGDKHTFDEGPATFKNGKWVLD